MLAGLFSEDELIDQRIIAGADEAGRGPLSGPVVAACCVLPDDFPLECLNDSKRMNEKERIEAEKVIKEKAIAYSVTAISNEVIDELNILSASLLAMRLSFLKVRRKTKVDLLLVDGNKIPDVPISVEAVVKGDQKIAQIMARIAGPPQAPSIPRRMKDLITFFIIRTSFSCRQNSVLIHSPHIRF